MDPVRIVRPRRLGRRALVSRASSNSRRSPDLVRSIRRDVRAPNRGTRLRRRLRGTTSYLPAITHCPNSLGPPTPAPCPETPARRHAYRLSGDARSQRNIRRTAVFRALGNETTQGATSLPQFDVGLVFFTLGGERSPKAGDPEHGTGAVTECCRWLFLMWRRPVRRGIGGG